METTTTRSREVLSPEEVADYLGCGRTSVYGLLAENAIPSFTVGRLRRVRRSDVERYVEERLEAAGRGEED